MDSAHRLRLLLLGTVAALCVFGLLMIATATAAGSVGGRSGGGVTVTFLVKQMIAMAGGLAIAWAISRWGGRWLGDRRVVFAVIIGAVLSLLVVLAVGRTVNGARRWIEFGPINLQPAELAKFALVLFVAWHFARAAERARTFRHGLVWPLGAFFALGSFVYLTKDLGSVVVMAAVLFAMLVMAGAPFVQTMVAGVCASPLLLYVAVWEVGYRRERFFAFVDPWHAVGNAAYHLQQGFIAIGHAGTAGTGLGQGWAQLGRLPERHTDFIYAVVCEELGMAGGLGLAAAYLVLVATGLAIAHQSRDLNRRLLATGAVAVIGTQAFWNMLVVLGAAPTKGLTLPFVSYGGSSLVVCLALVGILDAVARANAADRMLAPTVQTRIGAQSTRKLAALRI
jgi:cell division protein FtsW